MQLRYEHIQDVIQIKNRVRTNTREIVHTSYNPNTCWSPHIYHSFIIVTAFAALLVLVLVVFV